MPIVSDLAQHSGYLLRMVSNAVSHQFARKLMREGVTVAEWVMLRSLYGNEGIAPSALAAKMGMTKGAISKLTDRLLEKGLIARTDNPTDKRGFSVSLSPAGAEKVPVLAQLADSNDAAFFGVMRCEEQALLRSLLQTLIEKHALSTAPVD
ncbi:MAG: MarR family transcriptional regulator [Sphingobium sp.]|nr:MarR family transcriptional regulator [Sphingobium sp.]MBP6111838.1 MarR family transcriptional regulator [Sphingobium sp.]MBP8669780.1 MarR family transcriptional regulator [Sphingobium sp.]MBP9156460.1 MarR family transcriptional regulator [Sphingobium sp.]